MALVIGHNLAYSFCFPFFCLFYILFSPFITCQGKQQRLSIIKSILHASLHPGTGSDFFLIFHLSFFLQCPYDSILYTAVLGMFPREAAAMKKKEE
jgi:hypothetical protein